MPKRRKILITLAVVAIVALTLFLCRDTTSADAKYRAWGRTQRWAFRFHDAEDNWPKFLVSLLRIQQLQRNYSEKAYKQKEDLLRSGYLVEFRVNVVTNGLNEMTAIMDRLNKVFPPDARSITMELRWDRITILCRSNDAALCRQNLNLTNFASPTDGVIRSP